MTQRSNAAELLLKRRKARSNLLDFSTFTKPDYRVNWHHRLICQKLDEFIKGENKRLIISCPPRHGKSELVSRRFPAFLLGRNPDTKIIACSYSSDLASLLNRDIQRIIDGPEYKELFPETRLNTANVRTTAQENYLRNSDIFEIVGHKGVYRSAGVGGSITGMGGNCLSGETEIITNFGSMRIDSLVNSYKYNKWHNNRYRVLSYDHDKNRQVWKRIEAARCIRGSRILEITSSSGYKIRVTPEHRIFIHDKGYTEAGCLQPGDRIYYCDKPEKQRMPVLRNYAEGTRCSLPEVLPESKESFCSPQMLAMREGIREKAIRLSEMAEEWSSGHILFKNMLECPPRCKECEEMFELRGSNAGYEKSSLLFRRMQTYGKTNIASDKRAEIKACTMPGMRHYVSTNISPNNLLFKRLCRQSAFKKDDRERELSLYRWAELLKTVQRDEASNQGTRFKNVFNMRNENGVTCASHRREQERQPPGKPHYNVQDMSCSTSRVHADTISTIKEVSGGTYAVYDIQVDGTGNFFANQILVHNCLIIDDPFRSRADAESPTIREKTWEWYSSTFRTRRQKGANILVTATRWHEQDISGKLLELAQNDPQADQWEVITLPALSEEVIAPYDLRTAPNQALWKDEYPEEDLLNTKASCTVYEWLSLYQQRPSAAAGNLFKREHFKYATLTGDLLDLGDSKKFILPMCRIFQTCDPAASTKTTADYFVLGTWAQTPDNDLVLLDILRTRLEGPDQINLFKQQYSRWKPAFQAIESVGVGKTIYQMLVREGLPIKELKADTDKLTRALPAAARMEAGTIYFIQGASWLHEVEEELLSFPNGAHDDIVDVLSYSVKIVIEDRKQNFSLSGLVRTKRR